MLQISPRASSHEHTMPSHIKGWHRGERAVQKKLNYDDAVAQFYANILNTMPAQHREFHTTHLSFIPVTTLDGTGRPWGSILAGRNGEPGFITSPNDKTLVMDVAIWEGDPFQEHVKLFRKGKMLFAGIGIEFSTRRRSKLAGWISKVDRKGEELKLVLSVTQAIGNCPKYINIRHFEPHPVTSPKLTYRNLDLSPIDRLPEEVVSFVHSSDTVFIGTSYVAPKGDEMDYPSHCGMNHRGGRPGFVRVMPSDGRTLVLPDYSGNRMMSSLGNIETTHLASLTFVSFTTGSVLYLTGMAQVLVGPAAHRIMPLQNTVTTIYATGCILVQDALPVRQRLGTVTEPSPYNPPIRYLAEEAAGGAETFFDNGPNISATLARIELHSPSVASFTWETSAAILIKPGQAVIMDFTPLLGATYQHMAASNPMSVNDDRIRTWTVSSSVTADSEECATRSFTLTMREKPGGSVTGLLFTLARKVAKVKPEVLQDMRPLLVGVTIVGISGEFVLPEGWDVSRSSFKAVLPVPRKLLWVAGGIGVTPFLSMLSALTSSRGSDGDNPSHEWDIVLVLSTREPEVLLPLISRSLHNKTVGSWLRLSLHVFSDKTIPDLDVPGVVPLNRHHGRVSKRFFVDQVVVDRKVYLCGPELFEQAVVEALEEAGVRGELQREGFSY